MPEPLRSPKQSRVAAKSRSHPYARTPNGHHTRDVGVERSNSLLGALKDIVAAPLAWFSSSESHGSDDTPQKRRVSATERGGTPPKTKRVRRDSPEPVEDIGYLDPPSSLFVPKRSPIPLWNVANGVLPARTMSIDLPPSSVESVDLLLPTSKETSFMSRKFTSIEPQDTLPGHQSMTRDVSMPPPSPFSRSFSRSSFIATGATFGPSPKRRPRETTAPPLLGSSTATPSFTRPPTSAKPQNLFPRGFSRGRSEGPMSTLLAQSRQSVSPVRESPARSMGMLVGDDVPAFHSPSILKTERTLSTLESFRTPLNDTVFPSASSVEKNKPRKVHVPFPSKLLFDHTPEGKKDKVKRPDVIGPYSSGMSGMRKLLARRREELEKEAEKGIATSVHSQDEPGTPSSEPDMRDNRKDEAIETDTEVVSEPRQGRLQVNGVSSTRDDISPSGSPSRSKGESYSSLRAPSNKVHRSHASAPKLRKSRNKFSLDDDDDEQEWSMSVEDLKSYQARNQTHISFSTRRLSETGMQTDTSKVDVPPIRAMSPVLPAQPQTFDSLLSRIGPSTSPTSKPSAEFPIETSRTEPDVTVQVHRTSSGLSTAPATLPFSFGVSSVPVSMPKPADITSSLFAPPSTSSIPPSAAISTPVTGDGVMPSFFANTKAQFAPPKVPSGPLFGSPLPSGESEKAPEQPSSMFDKKENETPKEPKPLPFGAISKPSVFDNSSAPPLGNVSTTSTTVDPSPLGKYISVPVNTPDKEAKSAFSFGAPTVTGTDGPTPSINIFGAASTSSFATGSNTPAKASFSFNTPPSSTPLVEKPKETVSTTPSTDTISKPHFHFEASASSSAEAPKSFFPFGTSTQPKAPDTETTKAPFSFGAAPSTPPPAETKTSFTFGVPAGANTFSSETGANGANVLNSEPLKSVFGGFGGVVTSVIPSTPQPAESTADNGDGMEVGGDGMEDSPTRTVEKRDTAPAMHLPQSSPFAAFGNSGTTGFSFGQSKAPTENTFSLGQSKPMSVNGFNFGQNATTSTTANTSTGFSFGANSTKGMGQSSSPFAAPLNSPFGGATSNSTPSFSFAQPSPSTATNPFGQTQQQHENGTTTTQSAIQSQSPTPSFSFSVPSAGGSFGAAKPAATAPSTPSTQPFQFGASSSSQQPAGSPAMFTLGGAAATPPRRTVKGLPRRGKRP